MKNIPAFPVPANVNPDGYSSGMTLRDYFASHAPNPPKWWIELYAKNAEDLDTIAQVISQWNYAYADAMLKEREK